MPPPSKALLHPRRHPDWRPGPCATAHAALASAVCDAATALGLGGPGTHPGLRHRRRHLQVPGAHPSFDALAAWPGMGTPQQPVRPVPSRPPHRGSRHRVLHRPALGQPRLRLQRRHPRLAAAGVTRPGKGHRRRRPGGEGRPTRRMPTPRPGHPRPGPHPAARRQRHHHPDARRRRHLEVSLGRRHAHPAPVCHASDSSRLLTAMIPRGLRGVSGGCRLLFRGPGGQEAQPVKGEPGSAFHTTCWTPPPLADAHIAAIKSAGECRHPPQRCRSAHSLTIRSCGSSGLG